MKTLEEMQEEVRVINEANGWYEDLDVRTFGDDIALLHSEVSEMLEAYREGGIVDGYTFTVKANTPFTREGSVAWGKINDNRQAAMLDPEAEPVHEITEKDIAALVACGVAKPEGVGSEAADVFIRLLDTCERYGIDLRAKYEEKAAYNRTRGHRHGGKRL